MADYLLRKRNIYIPQTPSQEDKCPNWMQMGFMLFKQLANIGYKSYPAPDEELVSLEVYPHAGFTVLLDVAPLSKNSIEGRLQRQLILYDRKVRVPDPMLYFEEITRRRILKGVLPVENLLNPNELDALVAAYTAWLAATHPDQVSVLGDKVEGQIVLPTPELSERYS